MFIAQYVAQTPISHNIVLEIYLISLQYDRQINIEVITWKTMTDGHRNGHHVVTLISYLTH